MFKHSVKVPRLYKTAAKIAKDVKEGLGSLKQLVYNYRSKHPNIKAMYALVATLFQRSDEIENLLKRSQLLVKEPRSDPWLTKILIVELLWGKTCLPGNSKPEKTVLAYEQIFKAHISDISVAPKENRSLNKDDFKPRYVRVNTLYISLNEAIDAFREEGWVLGTFLDKTDYKGFLDKITSLSDEEFLVDIHVPNLLIFPPKTQFYNHPAYKKGSIVLQDKASCLPVHILDPPPGSIVLDMCASPGMKTTQVAASINNEGKVYAVERDPKRFETLSRIVEASGAACVTTVNKDVLTCFEKDFPGVQYILVDPSCSGSGMTGRLEFEQEKSNQRLEKLAGFQIKILRSALTRYPNVKRVVYSTCSIFPEENEDVVRQVLETNLNFKLVPATKFVNDTWKNFGSSEYGDIGSYCLYAKPYEDFTNGFFVAVFERLEEGEVNNFFNTKIYNFKKHIQNQEKRKLKQQSLHGNGDSNQAFKQDFGNNKEYDIKNENSIGGTVIDGNVTSSMKKKEKHDSITESITENRSGIEENVENSNSFKKKKKKKRDGIKNEDNSSCYDIDEKCINSTMKNVEIDHSLKKKKKKKCDGIVNEVTSSFSNLEKKCKNEIFDEDAEMDVPIENSNLVKKKKKKKHDSVVKEEIEINVEDDYSLKKKKKKKYRGVTDKVRSTWPDFEKNCNTILDNFNTEETDVTVDNSNPLKKKKKKKRDETKEDLESNNKSEEIIDNENAAKREKKRKRNIIADKSLTTDIVIKIE